MSRDPSVPSGPSGLPAPGRVLAIASPANPRLKDIRALWLKKRREETGLFLAEGLKLVIDALDRGWRLRTLVHAASARGMPLVQATAARAIGSGADVLEVPESVLGAIVRRDNPQAVLGVFARQTREPARLRPGAGELLLALDRPRDPGNLGTVIRTADAAGAKGVVLVGEATDPFGPEAVRATMGSLFSVPLAMMDEGAFLSFARGSRLIGTHLDGAADYRTIDWAARPTVLLMGNEAQGLTPALAGACDALARIPQTGSADSLNLAVATGVLLFEARRHALVLPAAGTARRRP